MQLTKYFIKFNKRRIFFLYKWIIVSSVGTCIFFVFKFLKIKPNIVGQFLFALNHKSYVMNNMQLEAMFLLITLIVYV